MKKLRSIILLLAAAALLLTASGCKTSESPASDSDVSQSDVVEPVITEEMRQQMFAELYDTAVASVNNEDVKLSVDYEHSVTLAGQTYGESGTVTLDYHHNTEGDFVAMAKQSITYGDKVYSLDIQEIYSDGMVYQTIDDGKFMSEMSEEDFISRYVPVKMLDTGLYTLSEEMPEAEETSDADVPAVTILHFESPTAPEGWLIPEDAEFLSASASAEITDGELTRTVYTAQYRYGAAVHDVSYNAEIRSAGREPSVPTDTDSYVQLDYIDGAYLLDHVYGYLGQVSHISNDINSVIYCEAAGTLLIETNEINAYAVEDEYSMLWEREIRYTDYSSNTSVSSESMEKFIDGKYSSSTNGGRETTNTSVTQEMVKSAIVSNMQELIFPSSIIEQVEITDLGGVLLAEFTCSEELGETMCTGICTTLFGDGDLLNDNATAYSTDKMEYYLAIDKYSMLPTAMGILYEATHTIQGYNYALSMETNQSFDLASLDAYDAIFDEPAPESEPENPATPLFYHVTGAEGQEMWLFGTIHLGDERTGFLPQEIYDAFYASDALAVECNIAAFEESVEEDEELQDTISSYYYYSDNSTIDQHIETPDLYDDALKMMKASGNYFNGCEYLKPDSWCSSIDLFKTRLGYALTSEKGVDNRLLALAEEDDMTILEVESVESQVKMSSDFSDHLQEFLLYCSMGDAKTSWESTAELYELWCAGDEAALIEKIAEEPWEILEEDFNLEELSDEDLERAKEIIADLDNINAQLAVLQEEYNKAMEGDRNVGMLEVAKGYLESGDTIFYAVGLAHLLAEDGLVNTLRDAGYTVELVEYQ